MRAVNGCCEDRTAKVALLVPKIDPSSATSAVQRSVAHETSIIGATSAVDREGLHWTDTERAS